MFDHMDSLTLKMSGTLTKLSPSSKANHQSYSEPSRQSLTSAAFGASYTGWVLSWIPFSPVIFVCCILFCVAQAQHWTEPSVRSRPGCKYASCFFLHSCIFLSCLLKVIYNTFLWCLCDLNLWGFICNLTSPKTFVHCYRECGSIMDWVRFLQISK